MLGFLKQSIVNFKHTGAICPSGRGLARRMTATIREHEGPKRVLEVGPGTGPFTREILSTLGPEDRFDIVEINPTFCRHLERQILDGYRGEHPEVAVALHESSIEAADLPGEYDHVVADPRHGRLGLCVDLRLGVVHNALPLLLGLAHDLRLLALAFTATRLAELIGLATGLGQLGLVLVEESHGLIPAGLGLLDGCGDRGAALLDRLAHRAEHELLEDEEGEQEDDDGPDHETRTHLKERIRPHGIDA